jgi:hypothetical protein
MKTKINAACAAIVLVVFALRGFSSSQEAYLRTPTIGFLDSFDYGTLAVELGQNDTLQ